MKRLASIVLLVPIALLFAVSCQKDANKNLMGPAPKGTAHIPNFVTVQSTSGASFTTDKDDYTPGEKLNLSGAGWQANDVLDILLDETPQNHDPVSWTIAVDDSGGFTDASYVVQESDLGVTFTITATGRATGETATATFTDAAAATVNFQTNVLPGGQTITVATSFTNNGGQAASPSVTFTTPGPSTGIGQVGTSPGTSFTYTFPSSVSVGGNTYNFSSGSPASPFTTGAVGSTTTVIGTYALACTAPSVGTQPSNQTVTYGQDASFTAGASGSPTVQWQVSANGGGPWSNIPSATSTALVVTAPPVSASGNQYRAVFTNACGSATSNAATLTVTSVGQAPLTITNPSDATYGAAATLTVSGGTTGGTVSYAVGGSTGCSVSGDQLSVTNAEGSCSVTATMAGDANYNPVTSAAYAVTLHKANQAALTITNPSDATYGAAATLTVSGGTPGGTVSYAVGGSTGCSVSGDQLSVTNAEGSCSVTATMPGDANYNPVTSAAHPVTLHKATPTITWSNPADITYGTALSGTQLNATSSVPGSLVYTPAAGTVLNAGSGQTLRVDVTPTDLANYTTAWKNVTINVLYASAGMCLSAPGHQILQPINADGSSAFKKGSTVPVKFRVCDAKGVSVGTAGVVTNFQFVKKVSGTITTTEIEQVVSTTPDTYFRWDPTDQQWIFNLNTKNLTAGYTYYYEITLNDGSKIKFDFYSKS
ncbi:MAG TPA: PxKF domain-containing protein [Gemmatimonadales bacterium]|nr:PxKF domain-containing protein [Gemmatimonadales bacterium]